MYLRASSEKERQRWLIALGSAKTCINNRPRRHRLSSSSLSSSSHVTPGDAVDDSSSLKTKKSELRLYCDLLMQQVHLVKASFLKKR
jgi:pleckstrin family protein A (phosphoinositide binding specific) protein 8